MGDSHVGLQARLMSQALRKLSGTMNKTKTTAISVSYTHLDVYKRQVMVSRYESKSLAKMREFMYM